MADREDGREWEPPLCVYACACVCVYLSLELAQSRQLVDELLQLLIVSWLQADESKQSSGWVKRNRQRE